MRTVINQSRLRRNAQDALVTLEDALGDKVVGQPSAVSAIVPYVQIYQSNLSPEGRPAGVFLLLGPSGTGKTRTVEALAGILHGNEKNLLKVDCGEFQMEHEVAKLIGAPPGYLGHRETQPLLTQARLNSVTSEHSTLSIILLDEIEKAAPSMARLLLGVLDKATLRLGDNNIVNFERSLIFMTSNLGAREMMRTHEPDFGFQAVMAGQDSNIESRIEKIGLNAVRRKFSPEFVNRIDAVVAYQPLSCEALEAILEQQLNLFRHHIYTRLGLRAFFVNVSGEAKAFLLEQGTSSQYGARELKRTIHRNLMQPIAAMVSQNQVPPASAVNVTQRKGEDSLSFDIELDPMRKSRRLAS